MRKLIAYTVLFIALLTTVGFLSSNNTQADPIPPACTSGGTAYCTWTQPNGNQDGFWGPNTGPIVSGYSATLAQECQALSQGTNALEGNGGQNDENAQTAWDYYHVFG